ncbi:MAG TPA: hypothetical protein VMG41_08130 [Gemmatimonadales bacterium]|nr:hypothetical protein [Gemmatimonadales bacterium]
MRRCFVLSALALAALARPVVGQNQVTGIRSLAFGAVVRGVPSSVPPSDPIRSGRFYVRYQLNRQVQVSFTLPTRLARVGGGGNLTISFASTDGIAQGTAPTSQPVTFNPNNSITFTLVTSADFYLNLGGTVSPAANQATGNYSGTVVLNVNFL